MGSATASRRSLDRFAEHAAETDNLRRDNNRLIKQLVQEKARTSVLVKAVTDAARSAIAAMDLRPVPAPKLGRSQRRSTGEEVAVAVLSDAQLGKRTETYNSNVAANRIDLMATKVIELTEIQRAHHPVRECRVWLLGDIVEGEMIFPAQAFQIDASLYAQVQRGTEIVERFVRRMLTAFDKVHVVGVIGNHGALLGGKRNVFNPETNMDRMLYSNVRMMFDRARERRVTFHIPEGGNERKWYAIDAIGNYRTLLYHGDQHRGTSLMPFYGFAKKINGWKAGAIREPFNDTFCGHWHQSTKLTLNSTIVRVNGSTESSNVFAQEQLASMGDPSQHLMFVHPARGRVTAEYDVDLSD